MVFQISNDSRYYVFSQLEWEKRSCGKESNESYSAIQMLPTQMLLTLAFYMPTISCTVIPTSQTFAQGRIECTQRVRWGWSAWQGPFTLSSCPASPLLADCLWRLRTGIQLREWGSEGKGNCLLDSNCFASKSCLRQNADRFTLSLPTSNDSPFQNFLTGERWHEWFSCKWKSQVYLKHQMIWMAVPLGNPRRWKLFCANWWAIGLSVSLWLYFCTPFPQVPTLC